MQKLKVENIRASDYMDVPVSGIWGGVSPQGYLHCDLFMEKQALPSSADVLITEKGVKETVRKDGSSINVVRESKVGLVMTPEIGRVIGEWLISKADEFAKASKIDMTIK